MEIMTSANEEGMRQQTLSLILRMLRRRVGPFPEPLKSRRESLTAEQLENMMTAALDFVFPADLHAWLQREF